MWVCGTEVIEQVLSGLALLSAVSHPEKCRRPRKGVSRRHFTHHTTSRREASVSAVLGAGSTFCTNFGACGATPTLQTLKCWCGRFEHHGRHQTGAVRPCSHSLRDVTGYQVQRQRMDERERDHVGERPPHPRGARTIVTGSEQAVAAWHGAVSSTSCQLGQLMQASCPRFKCSSIGRARSPDSVTLHRDVDRRLTR